MSTLAALIPSPDPIIPSSIPALPDRDSDLIRYEDRLLSRKALAIWLGVSVSRLNRWAAQGYGPQRFRLGVGIRYRLGDCISFIHGHPAEQYPDLRRKDRKPKTESSSQA
jgi:hypothetical protein